MTSESALATHSFDLEGCIVDTNSEERVVVAARLENPRVRKDWEHSFLVQMDQACVAHFKHVVPLFTILQGPQAVASKRIMCDDTMKFCNITESESSIDED